MFELIKKIKSIPELPHVAYKIIEEANKENSDYQMFAEYAKSSPALTFKIFQIINSPFYSLPNKVSSLPQAISLLGIKKIKNLALTIFVLEIVKNIGSIDKQVVNKWKFLITAANAAKIISENESLFLTTLVAFIPDYLSVIFNKDIKKANNDFYLEALHILAQKWFLPNKVVDAVESYYKLKFRNGNSFDNNAINIFMSESIANILLLNGIKEEHIKKIKKVIKIDDEAFLKLIKEIDINTQKIWTLFKIDNSCIDYSNIIAVFSEANSKIHTILMENEELLEKYTEANNILNTALNNVPLGVLMFENEKLVLINNSAEKIILKDFEKLENIFEKDILDVIKNKENNKIHLVTNLINGIPVEILYLKMLDEGNRELLFFKDLREEFKLKRQFKNLKENFASIINSAAIGICLLDTNGDIKFVNEKFSKIFKKNSDQFVGKKIYEAICLSDTCVNKVTPVLKSILHEKITEHKMEIISADSANKRLYLEVMITPYKEGKYIAGFQFLINDITAKKELELENLRLQDEFMKLEKDKIAVELAGATAHELNQPLTSLLLSIEILEMKSKTKDKQLENIKKSTEKIADIVKKLGDITRYESRNYIGSHNIINIDQKNE